jgi:hypothetical protein
MEKPESEMTAQELREKGARLAQESAKIPLPAIEQWIEATKEVELVYALAKQRRELDATNGPF